MTLAPEHHANSRLERYTPFILIAASIFIVLFSLWQGIYNIDPHHWGLMLSNAKDLYEGQLPYQEIFIQYGILTTIFQALAFGIGKNMLSVMVITSICYAIGLLLVYATALRVLQNKTTAIYVFILLVLFHPLAIYPWSNYIAFPFFMYGVYVLVGRNADNQTHLMQLILAGMALGLSVLAREGLAPAAILFITLSFAFDWIKNQQKQQNQRALNRSLIQCVVCLIGFAIPLALFFSYLISQDLLRYWIKLSIELPAIYADESFRYVKVFILSALFQEIYTGYRHGDVRWILTSLILLANLWIFVVALIGRSVSYNTPSIAKIALASLLLLSSSLHLAETFRIATGSAIGLIALFALLQSGGNKNRTKPFFFFFVVWLGLTATYGNRGNYFLPFWDAWKNAQPVSQPEVLRGQRWTPHAIHYYQSIQKILEQLQKSPCSVQYQINNTRDSLFKVISPIPQMQMAPFAVNGRVSKLRDDINVDAAIANGTRFVILESTNQQDYQNHEAPKGFILYERLTVPEQYFMPHKQELLIYAPTGCAP